MLLKQHLIWLFLSVIMDSARGYGSYTYGNENGEYLINTFQMSCFIKV